ncbi:hypothetical protein [Fimbriimonas ginsengisoli]|uniref:DUF4252 domain-containing protein n=1 Tax=Fimbriimonas ginsengisoli Gsoil 348 TaxID=661478 RepID=A0A068NLH5_FIMGI|nr:hypothetical protein [Fimbriimonas ginsengisoli]AIE84272.1 hypothetical protein OP10G_0904 [Fimbriimonas ginsengisoli Gsoil 348]
MRRLILSLTLLTIIPPAFAQSSASKPLLITLPEGAEVTMEVDARDDDILAFIKQALGASSSTPASKVSVPKGAADPLKKLGLNLEDVSGILRKIHQVHVITYHTNDQTDGMRFQEPIFTRAGYRRMVFSASEDNKMLFMRSPAGGLAIVVVNGNDVTVGRTDGMIDMALAGRFANVALTQLMAGTVGKSQATYLQPKPATAAKPAKKPNQRKKPAKS